MGALYDQLAAVWRGEAPIDSVPATMLDFNVHKAAEKVLSAGKHLRAHMMDHDYHPQIGDLVRARVIEIHKRGRDKLLASRGRMDEPVQKVRVHNTEWSDWT